jgi:hypothetical protein
MPNETRSADPVANASHTGKSRIAASMRRNRPISASTRR